LLLKNKINNKPIRIVNHEAIRLAKLRAQREGRSAANAASITIIEALGKKNKSLHARRIYTIPNQIIDKDSNNGPPASSEKR
jgi:hypothetical protein